MNLEDFDDDINYENMDDLPLSDHVEWREIPLEEDMMSMDIDDLDIDHLLTI